MSLRTRLYLVVGALVLVPLLIGSFFAAVLLPRAAADQQRLLLDAGSEALARSVTDTCRQLGATARGVAIEAARSPEAAARGAVESGYADFAAVLDGSGRSLAQHSRLPVGAPGAAGLSSCSRPGEAPPASVTPTSAVIAERVDVRDPAPGAPAQAVTATPLDVRALADRLATGARADVLLIDAGRVVATTLPPARAEALAGQVRPEVRESDGLLVSARSLGSGAGTRDWTVATLVEPPRATLLQAAAAVVLVAVCVVAVFAWRLARSLTRPLTELTGAAERVASGDLDTDIAVRAEDAPRSEDEVSRLAGSFSLVTRELKHNLAALERSRDEMRESLARLGETLENTHDLEGLLEVALETGMAMTGACAGVAYTAESAGVLTRVAAVGTEERGLRAERHLPIGQGVLGSVASSGAEMQGRVGTGPEDLQPAAGEPQAGGVLALPLRRGSRLVGVLAWYECRDGRPYEPDEVEAVRTLAGQAGIAVDNVLLHREAERLSITDPMTGLWNFRYLSMSLAREIERASRFSRPLAVLMLDLDHFKAVNDTYGHARGDAVLREVAARVGEQVRDIDTLARYGGEEFVLVLPETTAEGATTLAERVCNAIRREPFRGGPGETPLSLTLSVGVATYPQHGESPATLMHAADEALYAAKAAGRDRWQLAGAVLSASHGR